MPIRVDSSVWIDYFNGAVTPETDRLDPDARDNLATIADLTQARCCRAPAVPRVRSHAIGLPVHRSRLPVASSPVTSAGC